MRTHLELKHARQQLREMNDEKNEFMGIAAHDLRSPLNAVKGYAEMMREEPAMEQQERAELLDRIHDATTRMADMVQNLLDANRIERGGTLIAKAAKVARESIRGQAMMQPHHLQNLVQQTRSLFLTLQGSPPTVL